MSDERIVQFRLTTKDNPFDPFTDFDKWYAFDEAKGYHSCSYLARIAKTSSAFSDDDQIRETNRAIDEIIKLNPLGIYTKVSREW
jgi:hypothetical protein